jgi:NADH:ubiquinone oxidoreductase subunit K
MITIHHYLTVSAALFCLGLLGVLTRRNAVNVLMGIELILNSANINLVAFSRFSDRAAEAMNGQLFAVFVIVIAAAEVAVALAIILTLYRLKRTPNLDEATTLKG